jgi:hypothetical protein
MPRPALGQLLVINRHRLALAGEGSPESAVHPGAAVGKDIALNSVASRPAPPRRWQISVASGQQPIWALNGRELFFLDGNALIAVEIDYGRAALHAGATRRLFTMRRRPRAIAALETKARYAVAPDGKRLLVH